MNTNISKRILRPGQTGHLKMVPETKSIRESLRHHCRTMIANAQLDRPMTKEELECHAREILTALKLPEGFVGWVMVMLSSAFWETQIQSVPFHRRLLLLPDVPLKWETSSGQEGTYRSRAAAGINAGASLVNLRAEAERLGYRVLGASETTEAMEILVGGQADAVMGVASLDILEKAIDQILPIGIPCMAIPLLDGDHRGKGDHRGNGDHRGMGFDGDWVEQMVGIPHRPVERQTRTYLHLMRTAAGLFSTEEFERLCPRNQLRAGSEQKASRRLLDGPGRALDPIAATEELALNFLRRGGKQSRPFIMLAVYDALTAGTGTSPDGIADASGVPDCVKRTAMSIETFHKASLVHDDIQDDDEFRYGFQALHREYGIPTAINIGDYLIGLGYRLVSRDRRELGAEKAADILDFLADSHQRLCEGQGAELLWRDRADKCLQPNDALRIYALKTSPAFEAALYCGARLADVADQYADAFRTFARNLGVAFQILNDLNDWEGDDHNKKKAGADLLNGRPTILWALALDALTGSRRAELISLVEERGLADAQRIGRARDLFNEAGVFQKAYQLVDEHQGRAEKIASELEPEGLRSLLYYIVENVLDRTLEAPPAIGISHVDYPETLPIVSGP